MKEEELTNEIVDEINQKCKAKYKFTKISNKFLHKVLGDDYNIEAIYVKHLDRKVLSPTDKFKVRFSEGNSENRPIYTINNDYEITNEYGKLDRKLTDAWREGMKKVLTGKDLKEYNQYLETLKREWSGGVRETLTAEEREIVYDSMFDWD